MNKSELRKRLIKYSEILKELKSIQVRTARERNNRTREILALKTKIKETKEELYGKRMD